MDSQIRNDHQVTVYIHQLCGNAVSGAHDHAACYGKRTVQPGGADHAAVFLHVQLHILVLHLDLRVGFDLEYRGIAVACHDLKTGEILFRNTEGDQGRIISGYIVAASCLKVPFFAFIQAGVSSCF